MSISVDKIKTTTFVLKNRLLGYKLLQNPKGTNPNEVTMIKTWFGLLTPGYNDKCYHYHKIHRYKEGDRFVKEKTFLMSEYYIDPDTKTYSNKKKNSYGYILKDGRYKNLAKTNITQDEIDQRPLPKWQGYGFFDLESDEYSFRDQLFKDNKEKGYYLPNPGFFDRVLSFGKMNEPWEKNAKRPIEPNFWHVLRNNLKGGGIN